MDRNAKIIIYPVKDSARSKALFSKLLGVEPYADAPYYIGFRVGDQEIGLDPHGHRDGMTPYFAVDDIKQEQKSLAEAGAQIIQDIKDVGGGRHIAIMKDPDGNIIGLMQG